MLPRLRAGVESRVHCSVPGVLEEAGVERESKRGIVKGPMALALALGSTVPHSAAAAQSVGET